MQRQFIAIAGVELEVFEAGDGPPILFLHGAQGFVPSSLTSAAVCRHRLIAPSHPGFGQSACPTGSMRCDDIAYIHLELLDRLELDQVDVVGCSIGGWIAAELATKSPERVRRLVLVGPVGVKTGPVRPARHSRHLRHAARASWRRCCSTIRTRMRHGSVAAQRRAARDPGAQPRDARAAGLGAVHAQSQAAATGCIASLRRRCSCAARATGWCRPTISHAYARLLPNARIETIGEAGHAPHSEQPDAFARTVLAFLEAGACNEGLAFQRERLSLSAAGR